MLQFDRAVPTRAAAQIMVGTARSHGIAL